VDVTRAAVRGAGDKGGSNTSIDNNNVFSVSAWLGYAGVVTRACVRMDGCMALRWHWRRREGYVKRPGCDSLIGQAIAD
jgi:hypothetical protein